MKGGTNGCEITADESEEVARFGVGIMPDGEVAFAAVEFAGRNGVSVAKEDGRHGGLGLDAGRVDRKNVGTVEEEGDAAETLRLALGAEDPAGPIKPLQRGVGFRIDGDNGFQCEEGVGDFRQRQTRRRLAVLACRERLAVELDALQL